MTQVVFDSMTGTNGTSLISHVGETGATWAKHSAAAYASGVLTIHTNGVYCSTAPIMAYASGVPTSEEYDVIADYFYMSDTSSLAIAGRIDTATDTCYYVYYLTGMWNLIRNVNGSLVNIGSFSESLTPSTNYVLKLEIKNATKKVFVNGVEKISSTDNTITAAGRAGIRAGGAGTTTTGKRIDSFQVSDNTLALSDSDTISVTENMDRVNIATGADSDTISIVEAKTQSAFMTNTDSGTIGSAQHDQIILGSYLLNGSLYPNPWIFASLVASDSDTIGAAESKTQVGSVFLAQLAAVSAAFEQNIVTNYPDLLNEENENDIQRRSGAIHFAVTKHVRRPFSIVYRHAGIYEGEEAFLATSNFLVLDGQEVPIATGSATSNWLSGNVSVDISQSIDMSIVNGFGLSTLSQG